MIKLPNDHPFAVFNEYYYMESGTSKMPIYLWKKGDKGILVELYMNDLISGPRGRIYSLNFDGDYYFNLDKNLRNIIGSTTDDLYDKMVQNIRLELDKL